MNLTVKLFLKPAMVLSMLCVADIAVPACSGDNTDTNAGAGTESDSDADTDVDVDADTDTDTDADTSGFVPDPVTMGEDLPPAIPVIHIDVGGATVELDVYVPGTITIDSPAFTAPMSIEGRGNFTWSLPKRGYGIELQDAAGKGEDFSILGLPEGSDFALYACYLDKTCLRNALVFALGQELGRWSPRTRFVELYLDGEYQGLYMLWERVRHDVARVVEPVIVRHEGGPEGDGSDFMTASGVYYRYHYPKIEDLTTDGAAAIADAWQAMEDGIALGSTASIDVASWVDHAIVEEVTNNWDGYVHSVYMTQSMDGVIGIGPLWDFDLAFANGNVTGYNCRTDVWAYEIERGYPDDVPTYWLTLWSDPSFATAWKCRYQTLRQGALSETTFDARIDTWVAFTANARERDQERWPTLGQEMFPNCTTETDYDAEITYLRTWIYDRLAWLDDRAAEIPGSCE